jgi:plastocyanin
MNCSKLVTAAAFLLSCAGLARADTIVVDVKSNFFSPKEVTIAAGDTVRWVFDQAVHTTTSSDGLWDSGVLGVGSTFEHTFNDLGDFAYICTLHINCCNMAGVVHVKGPSAAQLVVMAPASVTAGSPFDITVIAVDSNGNALSSYVGTVTFASSDPFPAVLPASYTFTLADQGTHIFSSGGTVFTAGQQTLTVQDTGTGSISGTASLTVGAAPANHLVITAPTTAVSGTAFDVAVTALDAYGNVDTNYLGTVTWSTNDPDPGVLLPLDYPFVAADNGAHSFPGGVTLVTLGNETLTVTDTASGITGSATVTVGAGP